MEYHSGGSLPLLGRPRYCPGAKSNGGYLCETGHCCGETGCCTYYYELWWFWLLWTVLILFSCCCAYRHRRAKLRVQQQQRQREISLLAYHGASSYPSSMLDLSFLASLKLPSYEEVAAQPSTPPPPYSSVFTTPRYPQPPRTSDPHLLTQHGPLLHRRLSDGPSSFSSDNSSSCSCDSCCPSSPCSSSISAPVTYETDTSHATTPSEATPFTLEVTMEGIAAAFSCLNIDEKPLDSKTTAVSVAINISDEDAVRLQEPIAMGSWIPTHAVTDATQPLPTSCSESAHPPTSSTEQLDLAAPCSSTAGSPSSVNIPHGADAEVPPINITNAKDLVQSSKYTLGSEIDLRPSASVVGSPDNSPPTQALDYLRTFETDNIRSGPMSLSSIDDVKLFAQLPNNVNPEPNPVLLPEPLSPTQAQAIVHSHTNKTLVSVEFTQVSVATLGMVKYPEQVLGTTAPSPDSLDNNLQEVPEQGLSDLTLVSNLQHRIEDTPPNLQVNSSTLINCQTTELSQVTPKSPSSNLLKEQGGNTGFASCPDSTDDSVPSLVQSQLSNPNSPVPPDAQGDSGSCPQIGIRSVAVSCAYPVLGVPTSAVSVTSCPSITVESEPSLSLKSSPSVLSSCSLQSPSSPTSIPSPPASGSLPATAFLLDPLTVSHQSSKGESSSCQATTLSPSPRNTQSPPKQTLFSPCVDVFEPVPARWEEEDDDEEEDGNNDDDDMGADESQYRHRRLTGDSGIEVCRCQVEDEDEEEEEDGRSMERKENNRRADKKGSESPDLHDSVDCAARSQLTTGEVCNPTSTTTTRSEDAGKAVIVMETV